jgi:hypothetical protein
MLDSCVYGKELSVSRNSQMFLNYLIDIQVIDGICYMKLVLR